MMDADLKNFTPATERVLNLKKEVLYAMPEICVERARIITQSDKRYSALPPTLKRAHALEDILEHMSLYIGKEELIVGNQARKPRAAPLFPEFSVDWLDEELDTLETRPADTFKVYDAEKEEIREILSYWRGRTHEDRIAALMPDAYKQAEELGVLMGIHIRVGAHGHISLGHEKVLKRGLLDITREARERIAGLDFLSAHSISKKAFYLAVIKVCHAIIKFANRYADLAEEMAADEQDSRRKKELLKIADVCRWVPANAPRSFHEAIQTSWFIQLILQIESNGHSISFGRFDQYMYPFYQRDLAAGRITAGEAQELIGCLFVKLKSIIKVRPWEHAKYATGYPMYQNMTIGGQYPTGGDAVNAVSYLCINAMENVRFPEPNLVSRYATNTPDDYLKKCVDSFSLGFGMPAMLSDEIIIPSLLKRGVAEEDAFNYGAVGCIEVSIPGKWGYRCYGMTFTSFVKQLDFTLRGAKDPRVATDFIEPGKNLAECDTFDDVMAEWDRQNKVFTELAVKHDILVDECKKEIPEMLFAILVDDCMARGKTILEGGAVYDMNSGVQIGLSSVANSFAAIKKLVFEDNRYSGAEVLKAMDENFEGPNGEIMRQILLNKAPKYGNDDDYVDRIAVDAYESYMDAVEKHKNGRYGKGPIGCGYYASTVTVSCNIGAGAEVGATPDGRKAGDPVSEGASPHSGTDLLGPTAVIKSITKLPTIRITGGQLLNLKFSPSAVKNENDKGKLVDLLRAFSDLKGWHLQFNVINRDTLKAAQTAPDDYKDLMVRVAGYCALFTDLDHDLQNEIIRRTEHEAVG
jgi:pyruvate formate-lyase/glycerol dehydratase family glycyl radical enzyme